VQAQGDAGVPGPSPVTDGAAVSVVLLSEPVAELKVDGTEVLMQSLSPCHVLNANS